MKQTAPSLDSTTQSPLINVNPGIVLSKEGEETYFWPDMGEEVQQILGLPTPLHTHPDRIESSTIVTGYKKPDLATGVDALYVYSDVVTPTIVGDSFSPILRVIPVTHAIEFGENVDVIFPHPYYYKVSKRELSTITINIKDGTGSLIPFEFGRVIVTLHFKKWRATI